MYQICPQTPNSMVVSKCVDHSGLRWCRHPHQCTWHLIPPSTSLDYRRLLGHEAWFNRRLHTVRMNTHSHFLDMLGVHANLLHMVAVWYLWRHLPVCVVVLYLFEYNFVWPMTLTFQLLFVVKQIDVFLLTVHLSKITVMSEQIVQQTLFLQSLRKRFLKLHKQQQQWPNEM